MSHHDHSSGRPSQGQSEKPSTRRTDGPFIDQTPRAGAGLHPGSDRDDYGAPENESGRVGDRHYDAQREKERREPGQVEHGDGGGDTGAPARKSRPSPARARTDRQPMQSPRRD